MCEIQLIRRLDDKNLSMDDMADFMAFMSCGNVENDHAFGVFNSKGVVKHKGKFNYMKLNELFIMSDNFVVGHNRYATNRFRFFDEQFEPVSDKSLKEEPNKGIIRTDNPFFTVDANYGGYADAIGVNLFSLIKNKGKYKEKEEEKELVVPINKAVERKPIKPEIPYNANINNHPFSLGDFTMVHNGVISNDKELKKKFKIKTKITTDSFVILWLINKFFKESKSKDRRNKIIDAITKTTKQICSGYSVVLFDKKSKDMFYFKDYFTKFAFRKIGNKLLVGSTDIDNFKHVYGLKKKDGGFFIPKAGIIYLISEFPLRELYVFDKNLQEENEEKKVMKGGKKRR